MAEYDAHSKASTDAYREGYDRIFKKCPLVESLKQPPLEPIVPDPQGEELWKEYQRLADFINRATGVPR